MFSSVLFRKKKEVWQTNAVWGGGAPACLISNLCSFVLAVYYYFFVSSDASTKGPEVRSDQATALRRALGRSGGMSRQGCAVACVKFWERSPMLTANIS